MKKVLVIGAHSYIGRKFKEYVSEIYNIDLTIDMVSASDGAWRLVDFSLYDVVLHLSGIVHRKEKRSMEALYFEVNHILAVEIAMKAKDNKVKQFIFMSTAAVFGSQSGCITKETLPNPTTYYGKSKLAAEQDIIKLQDSDYHVAIVRPPMIYGDGCKGNYPRLVKLAKLTPVFPEYHNKRSMLHIDNLSKYLVELIRNESGGYFHPQDAEYVDTCEMIVKIRKEMGKKTLLIHYLNNTLSFLVKNNVSVFQKMFGNLYFEKSLF
ncbi:MAG: NAD-dependent epimerase/dehydratase family protein [Anaerocolumna sp.]